MAAIEARAIAAFEALGVLMTNTCINYQTVLPPVRGEHLALGDTGVVIYSNSVMGARSNFEGGPSALAAGLTGRTPRYGYHLDGIGPAPCISQSSISPRLRRLGRARRHRRPRRQQLLAGAGHHRAGGAANSDELKHFGAALASFGSVAMFHMPGVTPEAPTLADAFPGAPFRPPRASARRIRGLLCRLRGDRRQGRRGGVCRAAALPHRDAAAGRTARWPPRPRRDLLIVTTSPEIKFAADRMGLTRRIEAAGGIVAAGVCFYQMYAREMAEANGWQRLLTNSAKLVNIIGGYGYKPTLASMEHCVDSAD